MKRIEANTLQEAYHNATEEFNCSITELDIEVIQNSSSGFLGFFKKSAIIEVYKKGEKKEKSSLKNASDNKQKKKSLSEKQQNKSSEKDKKDSNKKSNKDRKKKIRDRDELHTKHSKREKNRERHSQKSSDKPKVDIDTVLDEISNDINTLFKYSCFELNSVNIAKFNEDTVLIEFSGDDAALLIGKEGYRYKALSYLIYNWINLKYGLNIRLEIAEFLKNQEEMISKYLVPVIERVKNNGRGQTKILDGVLIKIALEKLREEFPEKYVGIKNGREGGKFIVVNDFNRKQK